MEIPSFVVQQAQVYGLRVLGALLILFLGRIASGWARRLVRAALNRAKIDETIQSFVGNLVYAAVLAFAVVAALSKFGVETASFVAILGAASFAVGLALQGSLSNFAAGVMLLIFRPFKVGDYIEAAGASGTVQNVDIFSTILTTPDNVRIVVPNGSIQSGIIKNYSAMPTRRVDLVIGIGYGSSIDEAMSQLETIIKSDKRVLGEPEHQIAVSELADSSVNLVIRAWVNSADYWAVKFDLQKEIKECFDRKGIEIPFPQQVVHMHQAE